MPTDPHTRDDRPLAITEIENNNDPLFVLADRVITHLDGEWRTRVLLAHDVILIGPDGIKIHFSQYGTAEYDPRQFYIGAYTPTGRPYKHVDQMNISMLPSQIAAHLQTKVIPGVRRRTETNRKTQAARQATNDRRKDRIESIAHQLEWNSSSYKTHSREPYASLNPRIGRRRRDAAPLLLGDIRYDDDQTMSVRLSGLPERLVDQIVNLVAAHFIATPDQPETSDTDT